VADGAVLLSLQNFWARTAPGSKPIFLTLLKVNQQVTLSATSAAQTSVPSGTGLSSSSAPVSLQNSPSLTDDEDDDDDDGAATSVSDDANDLVCDLAQPGRPASRPDVEDHQASVQQAKSAEPESAASASEKGSNWVNSRRRKSSRPQWHYEGTVLDKSQRLTVNGTQEDSLTMWEVDQDGQTTKDTSTASADDDDLRNDAGAMSNCVTSH